MQQVIAAMGRLLRAESGQDLLEYGLLAALISVFVIGTLGLFGNMINNTFWSQVVKLAQNI